MGLEIVGIEGIGETVDDALGDPVSDDLHESDCGRSIVELTCHLCPLFGCALRVGVGRDVDDGDGEHVWGFLMGVGGQRRRATAALSMLNTAKTAMPNSDASTMAAMRSSDCRRAR